MPMGRTVRIISVLASASLIASVLISWKLDDWIARAAENYIEKKTRFSLQIGSLETDLLQGVIDVRDISLKNPSQFPDSRFLQINSLKVQWVWSSLFTHRIHLREAVVDIAEFAGVRNRNGDINVKTLSEAFKGDQEPQIEQKEAEEDNAPSKEFLIDRLFFQLESVTIADFYQGKHDVKSTRIGIRRIFNNVSDYSQIVMPLTTDLSIFVAGFLLDSLLQSTLDSKTYSEVIPKLTTPIKETFDKTKKQTEKALDKLFKDILPSSKQASSDKE